MLIETDAKKAGRRALALVVIYAAFWLYVIMS